jgi:threonine synthase
VDWVLQCGACGASAGPAGLPTLCVCGQPWLVVYPIRRPGMVERAQVEHGRGMWRFRSFLPIQSDEEPVSLGEGDTPLLRLRRTGARLGCQNLWLKDEASNPTGSFKARGLSAAITRAVAAGMTRAVIPTAGNAGVAAAAYGARAGIPVRIYAPRSTPPVILAQIRAFGGELVVLDGHIGDCGKEARAWAARTGAYDLSTLREPYRIEGKKTLGFEIALDLGWGLPDVLIYPAGGGTGLIGMGKAFRELVAAGWVDPPLPRLYAVQSEGCAPLVKAFTEGRDRCEPWPDPETRASGLCVPTPLGDRLMLQAIRETGGAAVTVTDTGLLAAAARLGPEEGIDCSPEGGASLAALEQLLRQGAVGPGERIVVFNTGGGWLYRSPGDLPAG